MSKGRNSENRQGIRCKYDEKRGLRIWLTKRMAGKYADSGCGHELLGIKFVLQEE